MNSMDSGREAEECGDGSWATETLPLAVRKQLLDRELKKLAGRHGTAQQNGGPSETQQQQGQDERPS